VKEGCAPLFVACKKGNVEIVEYFIEQCGADVEQKGVYEVPDDRSIHYVTPLWCASVAGKLSVVKCLVKHGANVNSVSDTGSTPVRSACFMTHLDIVTYLVENGADILKPNYNGGTCLINSVQSVPLCEFLLEHGADVNAQDIQFKTALHYAIQEHRFETTKLLLEHGAGLHLFYYFFFFISLLQFIIHTVISFLFIILTHPKLSLSNYDK
jgi:ankyrin repeat protein